MVFMISMIIIININKTVNKVNEGHIFIPCFIYFLQLKINARSNTTSYITECYAYREIRFIDMIYNI